jgi:site-specific DNA-methyltransferase (adenine-specific)
VLPHGGSLSKDLSTTKIQIARRSSSLEDTFRVSDTSPIVFSLGFALQRLGFKVINQIVLQESNRLPNTLHTAFTH